MKFVTQGLVLLLMFCSAGYCLGDILTYDHIITNLPNTVTGGVGNDVGPNVGPLSVSTGVNLFVSTAGNSFTTTIDLPGVVAISIGVPVTWNFSDFTLTGAASLTGFFFNALASSVGTSDPGLSFNAIANTLSFTTSGSDTATTGGGSLIYAFTFTDDSAPPPAAVPEPSAFAFLLLSGAGWLRMRRRSGHSDSV